MSNGSRLFYHGTNIEVKLGDRVESYFFCIRLYQGTVSYIPGISEKNRFLEYEDCKHWGITSDSGRVFSIGYTPDFSQPRRGIRFICRQEGYVGITPDMVIDEESLYGDDEENVEENKQKRE